MILGPDGPSLGGFVCPATIITADLWKLGQFKPGDTIRFVPTELAEANRLEREQDSAVAQLEPEQVHTAGHTTAPHRVGQRLSV